MYELIGVNKRRKIFDININDYPKDDDVIGSLKKAAAIHKEVRRFIQPYLKPNIRLLDIAKLIEMKTKKLSNQDKSINGGIGFPASLSLNNCAAHFHPMSNDNIMFEEDDIIKIDFGTEVNGWIIDSAFTVCFDHKYDNLLAAVNDATNTGIKEAGIDVIIGEWSNIIQEVMESYEIELDNVTLPIKAISNLGGHNILKGNIHGGMHLPSVDSRNNFPNTYRFKEGIYAIETFGCCSESNETVCYENGKPSLYRLNPKHNPYQILDNNSNMLLNKIKKNFSTLPFTDRYIELYNINNYKQHLKTLQNNNMILSYPPLCTKTGYSAQYEHTIYIGPNNKIVFSQSDDY